MKFSRKKFIILIILAIPILFYATREIWLEEVGEFLIVRSELKKADIITILGGWHGRKVEEGVELYKQGYAPRILITGEAITLPGISTTWPLLARVKAIRMGVPEEDIILEERTTDTYGDAIYTSEDFQKLNISSAIIVSNSIHMRRVSLVFDKFAGEKGVNLIYYPTKTDGFNPATWWKSDNWISEVISEYLKYFVYFYRYRIKM